MIRFLSSLLLLLGLPALLSAQLILRIVGLPETTPDPVTLYVAGNFNGWNPGDTTYRLRQNVDGEWEVSLGVSPGTYDYKFTRGDWATVEGSAQGSSRPNRSVNYGGGAQIESVSIAGWEDGGGGTAQPSTAAENVTVLDSAFYMPQLDRYRRIMLYLPPDYATSGRRYPVLYMHDGQNLFDAATSFSGEWEVDETLNALHAAGDPGVIVVGIDNGGGERINELTPYANPRYGGGRGEDYVDFIVETLKPHVDANFRTLAGAEHTGVMGSSLGGLISLYAAAKYPGTFGRAGVFSPSLWFTDDIFDFVAAAGRTAPQRYYFLAGYGENSANNRVTDDVLATEKIMQDAGFTANEVRTELHQDGQHSEWYWAREFGAAYQWLFSEMPSRIARFRAEPLRLWPSPVRDTLHLDLPVPAPAHAWIYDQHGRSQGRQQVENGQLDVDNLPAGMYWLRLRAGKQQWVGRFLKVD